MATCGLDKLAEVLKATVHGSQEEIDRRYANRPGKPIESTTVSIELDCRISKRHGSKDKGGALLTVTPVAWSNPPAEGTHRLRLWISSQQQEALVTFDGKAASDFVEEQLSPGRKQNRRRCNYLILLVGLSILALLVALVYAIYFHP